MVRLKKFILVAIELFQTLLRPYFAQTALLSRLYYFLFDRSFGYEQQAILKAKLQYANGKGIQQSSSSLLRRNIHRLEKGLIMRPRRAIFALDYIKETVDVFSLAVKKANIEHSDLVWANSILKRYFEVCDQAHPIVGASFEQYRQIEHAFDCQSLPYKSTDKVQHDINIEQLISLCKSRRSVRWFESREVPKEMILQALRAATEAPSACNRQAYEFMLIEDEQVKRQAANLPGGTAGFSEQIPALLAVVGDLSAYPFERDRHVIYIDSSLASMQFMLACETLGLSTCALNWPELHKLDQRAANLLELPQYKRIVMFIAVGYALEEGEIPFSNKKSPQALLTYPGKKNCD
ncbi:nitroreductase family protein [Pseudoalteromonas sp. JBTF-M23]|uniref:Nitroreductase family protein n=1 Tax=Pseudoalteromonas caenipelagi TaxID=2726988 RepID=A0A849VJK7_9GAMM|nr:nitroreductase family protein [Pseudoalteromonas caenipelagi]NOU51817.1 nitroreductase family protein [Pseudoalteromonas caenipelagi]